LVHFISAIPHSAVDLSIVFMPAGI